MWNKSKDIFLSYCVDDISTIEAMKNTKRSLAILSILIQQWQSEAVERMSENIEGKQLFYQQPIQQNFQKLSKSANLITRRYSL